MNHELIDTKKKDALIIVLICLLVIQGMSYNFNISDIKTEEIECKEVVVVESYNEPQNCINNQIINITIEKETTIQ